jgi:DNA-binding CsgD family transcriptional regulator
MLNHLLGFTFYTSWLWSLFLEGPLLEQIAPFWRQPAEFIFLTFLFFHSLSCFSCGYLLKHTRLRFFELLKAAVILTALLSGAFLVLPLFLSEAVWLPGCGLLGAGVAGLAAAPLAMGWCATLGSLALPDSALIFALSISLATGLTLLAPLLPFSVQILLVAALPLGSIFLFLRQSPPPQDQPGNLDAPFRQFFPWQFYVLMALIYIAGGSMFKLLFVDNGSPQLLYWSNLAYAGMCLGGMFLLRRARFPDLFILYHPVLPLVGLGFLILPLCQTRLSLLPFMFLQGGLAAYDMYTWLVIAALARSHLRPYTVCGYGLGWITFFVFSGDILYNLIARTGQTLPQTSYISALAGSLCLIATQLYPRFPKKEAPPEVPPPVEEKNSLPPAAPSPDTTGSYQIEDLHVLLTPRERQVLLLLTQGRNYKSIAEKLGITTNTVKFHVGHIYDKFGVYNRQELLELLEKNSRPS